MRIRSNGSRALALGMILSVSLSEGCSCGTTNGGDAGTDAGPPGDPYAYVTTSLRLPMTGEELGVDVDGDGNIDNALGTLLLTLGTLVGMGFDAQMSINMALVDGSLVMLWNITDVNNFDTDANLAVDFYIGENAMEDLTMYTSGGTFTISAASPPVDPLPGQFGGGALITEPSNLPLVIPLPMMGMTPSNIEITLVSGQVECPFVDADQMMTCVLGGAITQEQIDNEIVPAILSFINGAVLAAANLDAGMMTVACTADNAAAMDGASAVCAALDPASRCSAWNGVDMGICVDGNDSVVMFVLAESIDMDGNGIVISTEIAGLLNLVLTPDLDLDTSFSTCTGTMCGDGVTACTDDSACVMECVNTPDPACEGVRDALSIGLEFNARTATIEGLN